MKKRIVQFVCSILIFVLCFAPTAEAFATNVGYDAPYNSYTYWKNYSASNKKAVYIRPIYEVLDTLDYSDIGLDTQFKEITDIYVDSEHNVFILDGGSSRVVVLNKEYEYVNDFSKIINSQEEITFVGASGIFASNGIIYIADTENGRILSCDSFGNLAKQFTLPESNLIPSSFSYRPISVVRDSRDYMYVLSDGSYYGAILYSPDDEFLGFYGANIVKNTVKQFITNIVNKIVMNNEKRAASESTLPFQFTDLCIDNKNFVYTTTGNTADVGGTQSGQIRKLSPGGMNVLESESFNFADSYTSTYNQDLHSIAVDDNGYIYALDSAYGHIFVYDQNENLLGVFGSGTRSGVQKGSFTFAQALALKGDDVIVADSILNTVTIFRITDYGTKLKQAQSLTNDGHYDDAKGLWNEIHSLDKNCQLAYIGLAKANYDEANYKQAMYYAERGYDRDTYALAFEVVRNDFIRDNFALIFVSLLSVIVIFVFIFKLISTKREKMFSEKTRLAFSVSYHPKDTFDEIKEKQKGSLLMAIAILLCFYISSVLKTTAGGFCFTTFDTESYNALLELLQSAGLVAVFSVCFWGVSVLMHGQGKLIEIFTAVCYCLQPLICGNLIYVILTNVMLPSEVGFLNMFITFMVIYTAFLMCVALMRICDFEFTRLLIVAALSVVGIVIIIFIGVVIFLLLQLFLGFFRTVYSEIQTILIMGG